MPSATITIQNYKFTVPQPYSEGNVLNKEEAAALNQTYREALRNRFARTLRGATAFRGPLTDNEIAEFQAQLDTMANSYQFATRATGSSKATNGSRDPVMAEAMRMALSSIRAQIRSAGRDLKQYSTDDLRSAAHRAIEKHPEFLASAQTIINERSDVEANTPSLL